MTDDSIRVIDESDLEDFEEFLNKQRELAEMVAGHPDYYLVSEFRVKPLLGPYADDDGD